MKTFLGFFIFIGIALCFFNKTAIAGITLTKLSDMYFGQLEYDSGAHSGSVFLGTNGQVSVSGGGLAHDGFGTAARVTVFSNTFDVVEIRCGTNATLAFNGNTLNLTSAEASVNIPRNWGAATKCSGTSAGDSVISVLDTRTRNFSSIYIGGQITVPSNALLSGKYGSTSAGGNPLRLSVVVQ